MSLNPTMGSNDGESKYWNYSKPDKPGYSTELIGTVYNIQEVQAREYNPGGVGAPKFWKDGNPVMNIRMVLVGPNGGYRLWTFSPASKAAKLGQKKSVHLDLFALTGNTDMKNLIGKTVKITTQEPPANFQYGSGCPRPWHVELVPDVKYELAEEIDPEFTIDRVLCNDAVSGGQYVAPQQQAQPVPQPTPQPVPQMQQPIQQPQYYGAQQMQQYAQQQAAHQYAPQQMPQYYNQNAPQCMPPQGGTIYDQDIPF